MRRFFLLLAVLAAVALPAQAQQAAERPPDRIEALLAELTNAPGVSGHEDEVRRIVLREMRAMGAEVSTDGLGSAIGVLPGPEDAPRIMLAAHMDEIGLLVRHITPDGFLSVLPVGGWHDQALTDQRWIIQTSRGRVRAVSGLRTLHITAPEDRNRLFTRRELFLDIGARSRAEAEQMGVAPGNPVTPESPFTVLGDGTTYVAKAFDDRMGLVVMLEAMRRLSTMERRSVLYAVGTVQEEIGLRGARTSAQVVQPDIGISVEVGVAGDFPGVGPDQAQERLGGGPGIFLHDASMLPNNKLVEFFMRTARQRGIPLQTELLSGYGQDAAEMQRWSTGTPAVNFTVPVRYLHTFNGVMRREDLDRAIDLLVEVLQRLDAAAVAEIRSFE
jgi:putative aminopeptidase FrvX